MRVKTFEASDMKQALRRVREDLGPAAVIVSTRPVRRERGLLGLKGRSALEVTAALDEPRPGEALVVRDTHPAEGRITRPIEPALKPDVWAVQQAVGPVLDEVRALRERMAALDRRGAEEPNDVRSDLAQIRSMLDSLIGARRTETAAQVSAAQRMFYFLLSRGVDEQLARDLARRVLARVESGRTVDVERLKLVLAAEMRRDLTRARRGVAPERVQIFIGPSGAGKTTAVAKLAARVARSSPDGALVVTADPRRSAPAEPMARFGEMLRVPVEHAVGPDGLARAIERGRDRERILVDTPGGSHRDPALLRRLGSLIAGAGAAEVMLVLAATSRSADSREILQAYSKLPWSRLIVTKLDETSVYGELYNSVAQSGRPIACVSDGPTVPGRIHALEVAEILRKVLHG
jgi:flagellar biosynthesis protein FlhF